MNMLNKLIDLFQNQHSSIIVVATILFILLHYMDKIINLLSLFKKSPLPSTINLNDGSYSSKVLTDLDEIKSFQERGINYMERYKRETIFCLHDLLQGRFSYGAISLAADHIHVNPENKYIVKISNFENFKYYTLNLIIFIFFAIPAILFMQLVLTKMETNEMFVNISMIIISMYTFYLLARINAPINISKKVSKIISEKELFYTGKK